MNRLPINGAADDALGRPSVKILVACHKRSPLLQTGVFTPIHVGRAIANEQTRRGLDGAIGDDTGDNISAKNAHYCELTAVYWAWKNMGELGNPDYIGLVHYRRFFNFRKDVPGERWRWLFDDFSSASRYRFGWIDDYIRSFCQPYDVIVDKAWQINKQSIVDTAQTYGLYTPVLARAVGRLPYHLTVYQHFAGLHHKADLDVAIRVIKNDHPEMAQTVDRVMGSKTAHFMNMFIMKRPHFEAYCEWLFGILFEMERHLDFSDAKHQGFHARTPGFIAERILDVYLEHSKASPATQLITKECQVLWANPKSFDRASSQPREMHRRNDVAVAFATDEGYAEQTGVAMTSLLMNCDPNTYCHIHILDAGLSAESKRHFKELRQIRDCDIFFWNTAELVAKHDFESYVQKGSLPWCTAASFYRLLLPSLLPEVDRVLYLDGDIIVRKDLAALFQTALDGNYVGMASDVFARANLIPHDSYFRDHLGVDGEYFNAGVTLFDLAGMRRDGIEKVLLDYLVAHGPFKFIDQDLLNAALRGKIRRLDQTWNMMQSCWNFDAAELPPRETNDIADRRVDPSIVHFAGEAKPWTQFGGACRIPFGDDYWHYRELSPWNDLTRQGYDEEAPRVSIIIPTYNVADYLPHCLHTVMSQSLRNIEIIIVDDESSDSSVEIAEGHARHDRRIKVLRKKHGGVSAARNAGLAVARGEYIGFVDGDDFVEAEMFEKLYDRARTTKSDVVITDAWLSFHDGKRQVFRDQDFFRRHREDVFSAEQVPGVFWCVGAWDKIYNRCMLQDNNIVFPEGLFFEDHIFGFEALVKAKRIALVWDQLYHCRKDRAGSASHRETSDDDLKFQYAEIMRITKRHFVNRGTYDTFRDVILRVQFLFATYHFRNCASKENAREFFGRLRSMLDQADYATLGQVGYLGVEPVSVFARYLAANEFTKCHYWMKYVTLKEWCLRLAFRAVPASVRLKAVAAARLLPNRVKQAIVRLLPARVVQALTRP